MKNRKLIDDIIQVLNPLIEKKILKLEKIGLTWNVKRIEGSFDYEETKKMLLACLSIIRNHIRNLNLKPVFRVFPFSKKLNELDEEIYLFDKVLQAFLQAISLQEKVNESIKAVWETEMSFVMESHRLVVNASQNLHQTINTRLTVYISTIALLISVIAIFSRFC